MPQDSHAAAPSQPEPLAELQRRLGHTFRDPALLLQALTHRSYHEHLREDTEANERLEFLGDAILHFVAADELYEAFPEAPEGRLTTLRASLVRTESLAEMAEGLGLAGVVRVSRGSPP